MTVEVAWATRAPRPRALTDGLVRGAAQAALDYGKRGEIGLSVVFVDDAELARMHGEWLDDPTRTDVITFDLGDEGLGPAGELYVSTERAQAVAARRGLDPLREHLLYVVHGALHLCGFDDHAPAQRARMRRAERCVLARLTAHLDSLARKKSAARVKPRAR